jgi:hypothetical protein
MPVGGWLAGVQGRWRQRHMLLLGSELIWEEEGCSWASMGTSSMPPI